GRAPASAHGGHGLEHPVDDAVGGVEHHELGLVLRPAALGRDSHVHRVPGHQFHVHDGGRVVPGVAAASCGIRQDGGTQLVVGVQVGATHAFVHHVGDAHGGALPVHVHADAQEGHHDARILADGPLALGTHARVGEDLGDGIAGGG